MSLGSGVGFGLAAAGCWGGDDYCGGRATRQSGSTFVTLFWVQVFALLALAALLPTGRLAMTYPTFAAVAAAVGLNLLVLTGAGLIYRACAIGKMALVGPIAASYGVISALLAFVSDEHLGILPVVGIGVTLGAVIAVSASSDTSVATFKDTPAQLPIPGERAPAPSALVVRPVMSIVSVFACTNARIYKRAAPGLVEALLAMLVWGVAFWALRYPVAALGSMPVVLIGKIGNFAVLASIAVAGLVGARVRHSPRRGAGAWYDVRVPQLAFWWLAGLTGLLDVGANVAYVLGLATSLTAVVAVFASPAGVVTALLGWFVEHEQLVWWKWIGIVVILIGGVLVYL
ncbi:MAG TPA: hypothetical protein VGP82_13625 [Ktedonobacterales bacterium]|jgi:drug/metabolite transporter (DMT)-like permease|nr:hypothetical protein [Ktedonobacterales bacterium]